MSAAGGRMARLAGWWNRYWLGETAPHGLAAFRIFFGLFLLSYLLELAPHVELLFSDDGVYLPVIFPDFAPTPLVAWTLYAVLIGALVLFTAGHRTRLVTPAVTLLFLHHWLLNLGTKDASYDRVIIVFLLVSCFATLDGAWALGPRHLRRERVAVLPARLLAFQTAALYLGAGLWKLASADWRSGELLKWTFAGAWSTEAGFWLLHQPGFDAADEYLTWGTIALELALPFALYAPRTRPLAVVIGTLFHLSVWALLGIPEFMVCATAYVLFFDGGAIRRIVRPDPPARLWPS